MSLTAAALRRVAVAAQTLAAGGLAAGLAGWAGWPWPLAIGAALLAVLLGFGVGVGIAFAVTLGGSGIPPDARLPHLSDAPPRQPLGLSGALACYLSECRAVFRMFNWLQPFRSRITFAPPANADAPTVLLVHGYGCNHAIWLDMAPTLAAAGYRCEGIDLEPVLGDIDDYAPALLARMREIAARTGQPPLVVCHSMGGLAARAAQALALREAGSNVAPTPPCTGIVTLGSPHHGCALARFGGGRNARQMRWHSPWLQALALAETPALRARIVSVFSWHDSIAGPPGTAWLEGAHNVPLAGIGHVALLRHPRAVDATLAALAALRAPGALPQATPQRTSIFM